MGKRRSDHYILVAKLQSNITYKSYEFLCLICTLYFSNIFEHFESSIDQASPSLDSNRFDLDRTNNPCSTRPFKRQFSVQFVFSNSDFVLFEHARSKSQVCARSGLSGILDRIPHTATRRFP